MLKICLTGGPCAGKSESVPFLEQYYQKKGYRVYFCPEAATQILKEGWIPGVTTDTLDFQRRVLTRQLENEQKLSDRIQKDGADPEKVLVFFDRGLMDGNAYVEDAPFSTLLEQFSLSRKKAYARYDLVFHLVSTAIGARNSYTWKNDAHTTNDTRMESPEEAAAVDLRCRRCWQDHPRFSLIDNSSSFQGKVDQLVQQIDASLTKQH